MITLQLYTHYAFLCEQHISLAHVQALEWGLDVNLIAIYIEDSYLNTWQQEVTIIIKLASKLLTY